MIHMFTFENIGLFFIALAWIYQYTQMRYGKCAIRPAFIGLYIFGVGLIVIGGWNIFALTFAEVMNIVVFIAALGVLLASQKR